MINKKNKTNKGHVAPLGATQININLISEDSNQPRKEFNKDTLNELTETVKLRGVKSPISVRPNPDKPGTYLINHGARRFRASINAGLKKIPAFIDTDYSEADQVIENLQRDNLSSREIADFIGRQLAAGQTKTAVARMLGKTNPYITMHATLLDLPDPIADIYRSSRCIDVTALYDLTRLYKTNQEDVTNWLALSTQEEISRLDVHQFRRFLKLKKTQTSTPESDQTSNTEDEFSTTFDTKKEQKQHAPTSLLDSIYNLIKKDKREPKVLMRDLSGDDKKLVKTKIKTYFEEGKNCPNIAQFIISALQDGRFATKGSGALQLIAFLYGTEQSKPFDLFKILDEIANNPEAG